MSSGNNTTHGGTIKTDSGQTKLSYTASDYCMDFLPYTLYEHEQKTPFPLTVHIQNNLWVYIHGNGLSRKTPFAPK